MLVLGYAGHRRHGWDQNTERKLASRLRHARRHKTIFDGLTTFGEDPEDIPLNLFPLDGVGHDGAAAILHDGRLMAAAAEERFNRYKHSTGPGGRTMGPKQAAQFCLTQTKSSIRDVAHIAFYCDFDEPALEQRIAAMTPHLGVEIRDRVLQCYRTVFSGTVSNERIEEELAELLGGIPGATTVHFVPHHLAHAASAFYSSGYPESGVLTIDGFGEKSSSIFAMAGPDGIRQVEETMLPGSLGALYMMMTAFLGFRPLDGEYKVMGLASYGDAKTYAKEMEALFEQDTDGTCRTTALLRADFADHVKSLFGPARHAGGPVTQREMDISAALQKQFETAVFDRLAYLKSKYGMERLCLAGGAALNVVMTGKLARSRMFKQVYVFPAAGDDGASVGAAQYVHHHVLRNPPARTAIPTMSLGPAYDEQRVKDALQSFGGKIEFTRSPDIEAAVADGLTQGKVIGWFRGRMEFGPRALGNRSILADPRTAEMREVVNQRVKLREEFRPFAPAVTVEAADAFFDMDGVKRSDFMEFVVQATARGREEAKAVVHFDGSARVQTVQREHNPSFWKVIDEFRRRTDVPIVLNTSFNVRGEPIVCTPEDAIRCFLSTNIDLLAVEDYLVTKVAGRVLTEDQARPGAED
jgi:carbamoyltransferase